jgi:DNA-binding response OmpR family regulator
MTRIMIVDDEPDLREMVDLLLHKEGFETKTAEDGSEFLEKLDEFDPDIVILDVMMPGLTTSEILEKIKEKKSNPKIILLTVVRFSKQEIEKIYQSGNILDYITKPFKFNHLMNTIHKHILDTIPPS